MRIATVMAIALVIQTATGIAAIEPDSIAEERRTLDSQYRQQLARLVDECQQQGSVEAAKRIKDWAVPPVAKGQHLYLPPRPISESTESTTASGKSNVEQVTAAPNDDPLDWQGKWWKLRRIHAERLWSLANRAAAASQFDLAFAIAYQVLHEDPDHSAARRIATLDGATPPSVDDASDEAVRVRRVRTRHPKYGWERNAYWRLESPHYLLVTNARPDAGRQLLGHLEVLHAAWYQLFRRFVDNDAVLTRLWKEGRKPRRPRTRHRVVMFADRSEYVNQLQAVEPQIAISLGVYRSTVETAFFYAGDSTSTATWMHEASHQLFHELGHARGQVALKANFWIVEGIAIYLESLREGPGYCTVGGVDASRLQYARYRLFSEQFYVPLADLIPFGREALQQDPRIRRLYSQSAGLAHMLMDAANGTYRGPLIRYLRIVYDRRDDRQTLSGATGVSLDQLDAEYRKFLQVDDGDLDFAFRSGATRNLCLAKTRVSDAGLAGITSLTHLQWLDLTECRVGDDSIALLAARAPLRQVNLEGTQVSDASLVHLGGYETLEELDLSRTRVTDAGLKHLIGLRNLKILWLTGTEVTDASVESLLRLRKLELLELSGTQVSAAARLRLRDVLPQVRFQAEPP